MICCEIDFIEDSDWDEDYLESFFPRQFLEDNPHKAKSVILDLRDMVHSSIIREVIKPLYEYVLYHVIKVQIELQEYLYGSKVKTLDKDFSQEIKKTMKLNGHGQSDINFTIRCLEDLEFYLEDFFWDWDFLYIDEVCSTYLRGIPIDQIMGIDLDLYIDIIARDLKEDYLAKKEEQKEKQQNSDEQIVLKEVESAIRMMQNRALEFKNMNETEISNRMEEMIKRVLYERKKIEVVRESPIGCVSIKLGESDLLLYRQIDGYENIAIIENKFANRDMEELMQLFGYLNYDFKFGITITINKLISLSKVKVKIIEAINKIAKQNAINIVEINEQTILDNLIVSTHIIPENPNRKMTIYHFILHLKTSERQKVALIARRNNSLPQAT